MKLMKLAALGALMAVDLFSCTSAEDAVPAGTPQVTLGALGTLDFLKTNGKALRNRSGAGQVVNLRGTNAGGWLVQENWMNPTDAKDQLTMRTTLAARFGTAARDTLVATYEDHYWSLGDFTNCKNLGLNVLRLPFTFINLLEDNGSLRPDAWKRLDWFVAQAKATGLYVILDLHGAPGSQNGADHSCDTRGASLWSDPASQDKTVWLWQQVANHFRGEPAVAGYDLLNEPTAGATGPTGGKTTTLQWEFYDRLYDAVRAVDPDHVIIVESCWEATDLPDPSAYGWSNVMYEYHNYCWGNDKNDAAQKSFTDAKINGVRAAGYNVPTLVGEFTVFSAMDAWAYTLGRYNAEGWNWTTWCYKATGTNNNWGLYNHNPSPVHIATDTEAEVKAKWSSVGFSLPNKALADLVAKYAAAPVYR